MLDVIELCGTSVYVPGPLNSHAISDFFHQPLKQMYVQVVLLFAIRVLNHERSSQYYFLHDVEKLDPLQWRLRFYFISDQFKVRLYFRRLIGEVAQSFLVSLLVFREHQDLYLPPNVQVRPQPCHQVFRLYALRLFVIF